ncbi:MAG: hypothetical protein Q8R02_13395 [Hyphomonadaceae bacterium]|nr:hypothetical protein [Hyphomonadaceae bacterium]
MIRRYFAVVGCILAVLVGLAIWLKPKPDEIRKGLEEAAASYEAARAASPEPLEDLNVPTRIFEERDYLVAVSYKATFDSGKTVSCFSAFKVTICDD